MYKTKRQGGILLSNCSLFLYYFIFHISYDYFILAFISLPTLLLILLSLFLLLLLLLIFFLLLSLLSLLFVLLALFQFIDLFLTVVTTIIITFIISFIVIVAITLVLDIMFIVSNISTGTVDHFFEVSCLFLFHSVSSFLLTRPTRPTCFRSSHSEVLLGKGVLRICSKFTGEIPCQSVISIKSQSNFIEIAPWHGCSPVYVLYIFRKRFPKNTSGQLLLVNSWFI